MRWITSTRANVLACFLQMNSLDVYCLFHFEDKQYYARMVEVALTLDRKDFLPDGYPVDEEVYPRVPPKPAGRKGKAPASSSQMEEETAEDEEQDDDVEEDDDTLNLSHDEIGAPGGSEPPLTGAHLTSPDAVVDVLIRRRNVMTPRTLFDEDASVERPQPATSRPTVETRQAKRQKQSRPSSAPVVSSLQEPEDSVSAHLHSLEERFQKMDDSNRILQASMQQSMADQARENQKMIMQHQKEMAAQMAEQMARSQQEYLKMAGESFQHIMSTLPSMVMSIVQKVQTLNPTPLSCVDPQLMLTMGNSASAPSSSQAPVPSFVLAPPSLGTDPPAAAPQTVSHTPQSSAPTTSTPATSLSPRSP